MAETGENYTTARRMVIAARDPGRPPVALRVHLNPHVDLELTTEAARAFNPLALPADNGSLGGPGPSQRSAICRCHHAVMDGDPW